MVCTDHVVTVVPMTRLAGSQSKPCLSIRSIMTVVILIGSCSGANRASPALDGIHETYAYDHESSP